MKRLPALLLGCFFLAAARSPGMADERATLAQGYCYEMENTINALADFTYTKCLPAGGKVGISFIFISSEPVFSSRPAKKAWLLVVVGAFGHTFNNNTMKSEEVFVSDTNLMTQRAAYRMSAPTARKLQRQAKNNQIDLETMYRRILDALQEHAIPNQ